MKIGLLFVCLFLAGISLISAAPPMPSAFYGDVNLNDVSFPNGYFLKAKINNVLSGECAILDGRYGHGSNACIVVSYQGGLVEFFIGDTKIGENKFVERALVNLDFSLTEIPNYDGNSANGVCEVGLGECYFNVLDCDASVTSVCGGNNVCDSFIGETCLTTPQDCGVCPVVTTNPGSSSGSSGGSSSGSSSGSSGSGIQQLSIDTSEDKDLDLLDLGGSNDEKTEVVSKPGITGAVGGFVQSGIGLGLIIALIIIIAGVGVIATSKNKTIKTTPENEPVL